MRTDVTENPPATDRTRVLLVDDEAPVLVTTAALLSEDFEILTAKSGREALKLVANNSVDIVCADYHMPEMNGVELLSRVAVSDPDIARVLVTGCRDYLLLKKDSDHGASSFHTVFKPYRPQQLISVLHQIVQAQRMRRAAQSFSRSKTISTKEGR